MSKYILCGIALALLLLSGCASNPDVQLVELSKNTVVYDEIIRINNCGGKGDSEQTASREFATTVEFGAGVSAGYQSIVQGNLSAKYSEYRNTSKSQRLVAPPGTNMEFVLRWSDEVRTGNVQINGKSGTYEVHIPVSVEQISSRDWGCPGEAQLPSATQSGTTALPSAATSAIPQGPSLQSLGTIRIFGNSNQGVQIQIPRSGIYRFVYRSGSYSTYPVGRAPENVKTWLTAVFIYKGDRAFWKGNIIDDTNLFLRLADMGYFATSDEAEKAAQGQYVEAQLDERDVITFIAVDGRDAYADNPGQVVIEWFFVQY